MNIVTMMLKNVLQVTAAVEPTPDENNLLLETGENILLEDGQPIILE